MNYLTLSRHGSFSASGKAVCTTLIPVRSSLASAFVFALQGNVVHDLFYYGDFNGSLMDLRQYGWKFWVEWVGFLLAFPVSYWLLSRLRQIPAWLALVPVISSILLVAPALLNQQSKVTLGLSDDNINPDIFEFSSELNLVHLIPDGFQRWVGMKLPLPDGLLIKGNNLITLKFSETARPEGEKTWHTAGRVKRFSLVQ